MTSSTPDPAAPTITYVAQLRDDQMLGAIPVPFDPRALFGRVRAPVVVTLNGYSYRSTIASMNGALFIPLRHSHRTAAAIDWRDSVTVTLTLDTAPRRIDPPADLHAMLTTADLWAGWDRLSYTRQRELVEAIEQAKTPATRDRRLARAVTQVAAHGTR